MGIAVKYPKSECSNLIRGMAEVFRYADSFSNRCLATRDRKVCVDAVRELRILSAILRDLTKTGCARDIDDFIGEVESTLRRIEETLPFVVL
jgi:hypothetical protein